MFNYKEDYDYDWLPAAALADPGDDVAAGWDGGKDVEGGRQTGLRLEVADPQLGPGKLPLPA